MADEFAFDQAPLQDRDLLTRLSHYFDSIEQRIRHGEGWLIFNADQFRSRRIASFIQMRLAESDPAIDAFILSWRDFALNAFVDEIGLPQLEPELRKRAGEERIAREYRFARQVTDDVWERCASTEILMVTDLQPQHRHEVAYLDRTVEERYRQRLPTIIVTPEQPHKLAGGVDQLDPEHLPWERLFRRMRETCLVAV